MGFASKVLPEPTAVPSVHKIPKQLAESGTVTNTVITTVTAITDPVAVESKRERAQQQQNMWQRGIS